MFDLEAGLAVAGAVGDVVGGSGSTAGTVHHPGRWVGRRGTEKRIGPGGAGGWAA